MPPHNEQLQPTPFEVARPQQPNTAPTAKSRNWVVPALAGLLLLALLVIFWLPEQVGDGQQPTPEAAAEPAASAANGAQAPSPTAPAGADSTPWSDAQAAKLRKEAQDVLAELLDTQFALEERGVSQWAADEFAAAREAAANGDELYKQRQYVEAKEYYQQGLAQLQALQESIPARVEQHLQLARQGIEEGRTDVVTAALDLANLIEPENAALAELDRRAAILPQLLALLQQATALEADGDLAGAEQQLQQAAELDPAHRRTAAELERVAEAHLEQQFSGAMSDGYSALDAGRFEAARKAFRQAGKLQAGSAEAASALQELASAEQAYRLNSLKNQGESLERQEQWQQAVTAYEQAQAIDEDVLFVRQGLQRARDRARLDKLLRSALDQPERLSDAAVAGTTEKLLSQARTIDPRGPVLTQQIEELDTLLRQAAIPITITLQSDAQTEVILYKVARLGRFQHKELTLRPGTYTVKGTRNGYRDVLRRFTISHDSPPRPVVVTCTEPI